MMGLLRQATQAFVEDVSISLSNLPAGIACIAQIPEKASPIYNGERLISYAILTGDSAGNDAARTDDGAVKEATAVLTGKIASEEIRHELKVVLSLDEGRNVDHKMPLHRLAGKTLIKHLETKLDDQQQRGLFGMATAVEEIKREIIAISTSANVSSRYTAFVGVDPSTKDKNVKVKMSVPRAGRRGGPRAGAHSFASSPGTPQLFKHF